MDGGGFSECLHILEFKFPAAGEEDGKQKKQISGAAWWPKSISISLALDWQWITTINSDNVAVMTKVRPETGTGRIQRASGRAGGGGGY